MPADVSELLEARYRSDWERVEELLAANPELDVFEAATFGRTERLAELLDADASAASGFAADGFTPLQLASFFEQPAAVALLLERGADPNAVATNPMRVQAIHSAAAAASAEIVGLLLAAGADANARQEGGFTPIHAAAQNGDEVMTRLLLDSGADAEATTDEGRTPADFARERGHEAVVNLLQAGV